MRYHFEFHCCSADYNRTLCVKHFAETAILIWNFLSALMHTCLIKTGYWQTVTVPSRQSVYQLDCVKVHRERSPVWSRCHLVDL